MGEISDEEFRELNEAYEAMMEERRKMKSLEDDLFSYPLILLRSRPFFRIPGRLCAAPLALRTSSFVLRDLFLPLQTLSLTLRTTAFALHNSRFPLRTQSSTLCRRFLTLRQSPFALRFSRLTLRTSLFALRNPPLAL